MPETFPAQSGIPLMREDLNKTVEDVVSSYEAKIENINSFFETTHLIFSEFQDPLLDTKQERDQINCQLQDLLAKNQHLRRTDFNRMMQGILALQVEKEKEIRNLVNSFLTEQKEMVNLLRDNLTKIKATLANGQGVDTLTSLSVNGERSRTIEIKESKELIGKILVQQDKRKQKVSLKLKEFQKEQKEMTQRLQELLVKGKELRIKDLKSILKEFDVQHKERLTQQEERKIEVQKRKGEVRGMLVEFKKKRKESVKTWRINQPKANSSVKKIEEVKEDNSVSNPSISLGISPEQSRRANGVNINVDVVKEGVTK